MCPDPLFHCPFWVSIRFLLPAARFERCRLAMREMRGVWCSSYLGAFFWWCMLSVAAVHSLVCNTLRATQLDFIIGCQHQARCLGHPPFHPIRSRRPPLPYTLADSSAPAFQAGLKSKVVPNACCQAHPCTQTLQTCTWALSTPLCCCSLSTPTWDHLGSVMCMLLFKRHVPVICQCRGALMTTRHTRCGMCFWSIDHHVQQVCAHAHV